MTSSSETTDYDAWNRAACGLLDQPSEVELTAGHVLQIIDAENTIVVEVERSGDGWWIWEDG